MGWLSRGGLASGDVYGQPAIGGMLLRASGPRGGLRRVRPRAGGVGRRNGPRCRRGRRAGCRRAGRARAAGAARAGRAGRRWRFEGHQGPERGGPHVAQREHLEGVRKDREQQGQSGCGGQDAGGEMSGGLRDAGERCGGGGDGDGEREPLDAGEAVYTACARPQIQQIQQIPIIQF